MKLWLYMHRFGRAVEKDAKKRLPRRLEGQQMFAGTVLKNVFFGLSENLKSKIFTPVATNVAPPRYTGKPLF